MTAKDDRVSSSHKALDILLLYRNQRAYLSIDEISRALDMPKSTVYRYVRVLCDNGFLERTDGANYQLGLTLLALGRTALNSNRDIRIAVLPAMTRIADQIGESVTLMRLFNRQVVCVESIEGKHALRVTMERGRVQPLHAGASSKLLLAALPETEWQHRLEFPLERFTDATITDFDALRDELRRIQRAGYSTSDGEIDAGARAVAVPLKDAHGHVVAALSVEGPTSRVDDASVTRYRELLQQEACAIQHELS